MGVIQVINEWTKMHLPIERLVRRLIYEILNRNLGIIESLQKDPRCSSIRQEMREMMKDDPKNWNIVQRRLMYSWIRHMDDIPLADPRRYPLKSAKELGAVTFGIVYLTKDKKTRK